MIRRRVVVLGSTGTVGSNTLDVIDSSNDLFDVVGLAARGSNFEILLEQIQKFSPSFVSVATKSIADKLMNNLNSDTKIFYGEDGAVKLVEESDADLVICAMVGLVGLAPALAALEQGADIAIANKEILVGAGELVINKAKEKNRTIIPIDSEHSAIFQAVRGERLVDIKKIILTASGGPFKDFSHSKLTGVTVEQAIAHPNWKMGKKISIDSATMMNKGLELIEAKWLFAIPPARLSILIHPESIIHSMVEFCDRSIIAQLGLPDMRVPISFALNYPNRLALNLKSLDLLEYSKLTFEPPDYKKFPALQLVQDLLDQPNGALTALNSANEVAVEAFINGEIGFVEIVEVVTETVEKKGWHNLTSLDEIFDTDRVAGNIALDAIKRRAR